MSLEEGRHFFTVIGLDNAKPLDGQGLLDERAPHAIVVNDQDHRWRLGANPILCSQRIHLGPPVREIGFLTSEGEGRTHMA